VHGVGKAMKHYRVYKLKSRDGGIVKAKDIEAADNTDAMAQAARDSDCPVCEVWQSTQKVGVVD
jgi:hypothetical protein